jgi:hypothetical protein
MPMQLVLQNLNIIFIGSITMTQFFWNTNSIGMKVSLHPFRTIHSTENICMLQPMHLVEVMKFVTARMELVFFAPLAQMVHENYTPLF